MSADPSNSWHPVRLRVPHEDRAVFALPDRINAPELVAANRESLAGVQVNLQGKTCQELRAWTRTESVGEAVKYTARITGSDITVPDYESIIMGGHQPSLFHSGVWVKNFAIGGIAERTGGLALNLVIDHDLLTDRSLSIPVGEAARPTIGRLSFDRPHAPSPWEQAAVCDRAVFDSFGRRAADRMAQWGIDPLVARIWPDAIEVVNSTGRLGEGLTAARHRLERRWGLKNLELPVSRLCRTDSFLWFASHLLAQLPRFRRIHNEVLSDYRRVNRVRSRTHPVPELGCRQEWLEAPFWVLRADDPRRHRLYARQQGATVELSDRAETIAILPLSPDKDASCAVEVLRDLPRRDIHLRTRALTTTMFARLCLCDMFVHGIGGAKYDEITDRIMRRLFGIDVPRFQTFSATLHLPIDRPEHADRRTLRQLNSLLRDLEQNPDRHLSRGHNRESDSLLAEKQSLVAEERAKRCDSVDRPSHRENYARCLRLREVNRLLRPFVVSQKQAVLEAQSAAESRRSANAVLANREYSFALFPEGKLRRLVTSLFD